MTIIIHVSCFFSLEPNDPLSEADANGLKGQRQSAEIKIEQYVSQGKLTTPFKI